MVFNFCAVLILMNIVIALYIEVFSIQRELNRVEERERTARGGGRHSAAACMRTEWRVVELARRRRCTTESRAQVYAQQ